MSNEVISETGLSNRWGLSKRTLQRWRWQRKGPPYLKLGGHVAYRVRDVEEWEEKQRHSPEDSHRGGSPGKRPPSPGNT